VLYSLLIMLSGCSKFGYEQIAPDRFNYNESIAQSANEQMLLNLVRLRYQDVPVFLAVGSVLTQYVYAGNAGINAAAVESGSSIAGISAGMLYIERPTITYNPLSGDDFARQLLTPIPAELIFSLIQSGWPADQLLKMTLQRINGISNAPINAQQGGYDQKARQNFQRMVELTLKLRARSAIEMQAEINGDKKISSLVFEDNKDASTIALINEFKALLHLHPEQSVFRVTTQIARREQDEITIKVRSILTLMIFLATGVEVPDAMHQHSWQADPNSANEVEEGLLQSPLQVYAHQEEPGSAFVTVQYRQYWYFIKNTDLKSKQAFGLLTYLFQLQSPKSPAQAPVLTIPTG
jgi:hypothetical protein